MNGTVARPSKKRALDDPLIKEAYRLLMLAQGDPDLTDTRTWIVHCDTWLSHAEDGAAPETPVLPRDKLGWICSICGCWNHPGNQLCEHRNQPQHQPRGELKANTHVHNWLPPHDCGDPKCTGTGRVCCAEPNCTAEM